MTSWRILALDVVAEREFGGDENEGFNVVDFGVHNGKDTFGSGLDRLVVAAVVEKV